MARSFWHSGCGRLLRLRRFSIVALFLVALTGCSGIGTSNDAVNDDAAAPNPPQVSPLAEYLGVVWGTEFDPAERLRRAEAENVRRLEFTTQCMHEAGFNFDPNNLPANIGFSFPLPPAEGAIRPDDREWIMQYGYGIVVNPGRAALVAGSQTGDENGLSDAERDAFARALFGRMTEIGVADEIADMTLNERLEIMGCLGWAEAQLQSETSWGVANSDEFIPLFDAIETMESSLRSEITEADLDWSACMADAGFAGMQRQSEAQENLWSDWVTVSSQPGLVTDTLPPVQAALQEREIATALADYDCRVATDFSARQFERRSEVETQFIADNRGQLTALRSAAEQRG